MIESDVRTVLIGDSAVSAIVAQRVAAGLIPEGEARPYITYQLIAGTRFGSMSAPGLLRNARIQFNCWSPNYAQAKALALAAQDALDAASLFAAVLVGEQDLYDGEAKLHYVVLDYSLWASNPDTP